MRPALKSGDYHILVNGQLNTMQAYHDDGKPANIFPTPLGATTHSTSAFPHGVYGRLQTVRGGDTIAQVYTLGNPILTQDTEPSDVRRSYGWAFTPMLDYEGKMAEYGRDGFGIHGGGEWASYWQDYQKLTHTMGCIRVHNKVAKAVADLVTRTKAQGKTVWLTVTQ